MAEKKSIVIIQGANWGSESKGAAAHALCLRENIHWAVRTGSINAGHTIIADDGQKRVFQQLPTGAFIDGMNVVIGPGAYIHLPTLLAEVEMSKCTHRLFLDHNCGVHLDDYTHEAKEAGRNLKIGATGKGCAEAIVHKIQDRGNGKTDLLFREFHKDYSFRYIDVADELTRAYDRGERILIEGTQGTLLDFHCGPYPYVTSRQTISAAWVAEAGLSPALDYEVVLVARTYPIRVAGNSGPMKNETSWPALARQMNARLKNHGYEPIVPEEVLCEFEVLRERIAAEHGKDRSWSENSLFLNTEALLAMQEGSRHLILKLFETTTVTKRLRRIARLDLDQLRLTVRKERPAYMILTFLNYEFPEIAHTREIHAEALAYVSAIEKKVGCKIRYVTIGPRHTDMIMI